MTHKCGALCLAASVTVAILNLKLGACLASIA
jgi:hypothetical protein